MRSRLPSLVPSLAFVFAFALGEPAGAQETAALFPAPSRPKAAKLLDSLAKATKALDTKRQSALKSELSAESEMVRAYALLAAASAGKGPYASADGTERSIDASAAFTSARSRAKAAALSLARGEEGSATFVIARDEAASSLANLIRSSGMSGKSAILLDRRLSTGYRSESLFPEAIELKERLRSAGASGAREAAAAAARGSAEGMALHFIESRSRIEKLAPGTGDALARLELVSRAYRSWIEAFAYSAYPDYHFAPPEQGPSAASSAVSAMARLGSARLLALVAAMERGDAREVAAARAARALAETWLRSPESRRRDLACLYGLPASVLPEFCFALGPRERIRPAPAAGEPLPSLRALNELASRMAEEGESGRGPEPALLLLERPGLEAVARAERRYATLYAEASGRIGMIYARAADDAAGRLESVPTIIAAAARALGTAPASMSVRAVDLRPNSGAERRRLAFEAAATDAAGNRTLVPVEAEIAGRIYARAFAAAAGLDAGRQEPAAILSRYGQSVASAYDPSDCDGALCIGEYPERGIERLLGPVDLELALLGGWRP